MRWVAARVSLLALSLACVASALGAATGHEAVPEPAKALLKEHFHFDEVTKLLEKRPTQQQAAKELEDRYYIDGRRKEDDTILEGYRSRNGPAAGLTLTYVGKEHELLMVNVLVFDAEGAHAADLKARALDSVDAEPQPPAKSAKLYFLGIHRLSPSRVIKIVLREDVGERASLYSVEYAASDADDE